MASNKRLDFSPRVLASLERQKCRNLYDIRANIFKHQNFLIGYRWPTAYQWHSDRYTEHNMGNLVLVNLI